MSPYENASNCLQFCERVKLVEGDSILVEAQTTLGTWLVNGKHVASKWFVVPQTILDPSTHGVAWACSSWNQDFWFTPEHREP